MQELVKKLHDLKSIKAEINAQLKDINKEISDTEIEILNALDQLGVDQIRTDVLTVGVNESIVPQVTDWDAFYKFMLDNNALYMMERRPAAIAFREYLELHGAPPAGVEPFTKRTISTRKVS